MSAKTNGGPAFPAQPIYQHPHGATSMSSQDGMTLRDWFAGQAIGHVVAAYALANPVTVPGFAVGDEPLPTRPGIGAGHLPRNTSAIAYKIADAMIAERSK